MNWNLIAETCPKAYKEYEPLLVMPERDLYDHFDALGIRCICDYNPAGFTWAIYPPDKNGYPSMAELPSNLQDVNWESRTACESDMFTRAFRIREAQINNQQ